MNEFAYKYKYYRLLLYLYLYKDGVKVTAGPVLHAALKVCVPIAMH